MDRNNDGVVTIDEFIESCQKVCSYTQTKHYLTPYISTGLNQ